MERTRNNCRECPHSCLVPGSSHHLRCTLMDRPGSFLVAEGVGMGKIKGVENEITGLPLLEFDPHGAANGWCMWPENFDPIWVKCFLPIKTTENDELPQPE